MTQLAPNNKGKTQRGQIAVKAKPGRAYCSSPFSFRKYKSRGPCSQVSRNGSFEKGDCGSKVHLSWEPQEIPWPSTSKLSSGIRFIIRTPSPNMKHQSRLWNVSQNLENTIPITMLVANNPRLRRVARARFDFDGLVTLSILPNSPNHALQSLDMWDEAAA